ncbi:MAG: AI-2E family transporter, partial [Pseudomonadota bacterium]
APAGTSRPPPPRWGVVVVLLAAIAVLVGLFWLVGDRVGAQFRQLTQSIPQALDAFEGWVRQHAWGEFLVEQTRSLDTQRMGLFSQVTGLASSVLATTTDIVLILVVMIFMALEPHLYVNGLVALFPLPSRPRVREVLGDVERALRYWLLGQGISMVIIGAITTAGLLLLGIPLALALGVLALVLEFIPFIGPVLAAIPAILFAFTVGPTKAMWVALFYLAVQQIEGNLVMPFIQERVVRLPPVLTVTAAVAMAVLFGFAGLVFATPLVVALMVLVQKVYVEDVLGDKRG